jgi:hypothetical protein
MSARCAEVLSSAPASPEVKSLRITERVEGFFLEQFAQRGEAVGEAQFETLDDAMRHVYAAYGEISDWRFCGEGATDEPPGRSA